jgi:hypothetical protein
VGTKDGKECVTRARIRAPFDGEIMTRAQIRAPFDGEIISHETRFSDTIDNVKAKIDNVKAKTQDEED